MLDPYTKASDVWFHLHQAEQLVINDKNYHPDVTHMLNDCMDIVETFMRKFETSDN